MRQTDYCEKCGCVLQIGDYPFCPHGTGSFNAQADDVPGGFTVENAWSEPRTFYSQSAYERALKQDGMELAPRWVPGSKHLSNWSTIDPYTMENARILSARQAQTTVSPHVTTTLKTLKISVGASHE